MLVGYDIGSTATAELACKVAPWNGDGHEVDSRPIGVCLSFTGMGVSGAPYLTLTANKYINRSFVPSVHQLSLAKEFAIVRFHINTQDVDKEDQATKIWSLRPSRRRDVLRLLSDSSLSFDFYDIDGPFRAPDNNTPTSWADSLAFTCWNARCFSKGWPSEMIPVTIRLNSDSQYYIRVYSQRCQGCGKLSRPRLDGSYVERFVYRQEKWSVIDVEPVFF